MTRISAHVCLLFILGCWASSSNGTTISLEDKLNRLESKFDAEVYQLKVKNDQLEAQLELNNQIRNDLKLKVTQLEGKVRQQEMILTSLLRQTDRMVPATGTKSFPTSFGTSIQSIGISGTPRTCREIRVTDPSLPSGMYSIDPDGEGVGENPIDVYCDMTSGSTSIIHDSESPINVNHCADPGCYSRSIKYNASISQMKALAELSTECHQSIKYDCFYAPFEFNNIAYAWWNDRDGNAQYFWAGNNTVGIHTCQCGMDGDCVDRYAKCNCDAAVSTQLTDDGVITDKNVLPITRLNFGRTQLETSSGIHTLGRFECTGIEALTRMPTSCQDLWLIGHTLNGFFSVMGSKTMESVYCDFTKIPGDEGFQKWIGYADVKSMPTFFYFLRNSNFDIFNTTIPFDIIITNIGNAMNTSGIFTAPRMGTYFFSFTGMAYLPASSTVANLGIALYKGAMGIGVGLVKEDKTYSGKQATLAIQSTLKLQTGDQVYLRIHNISPGAYLFEDGRYLSHFTGFMLEEDIEASL